MLARALHHREYSVVMLREDLADFAKLLRSHFPSVKFVRIDSGERWIVADAPAAEGKPRLTPAHQPHTLTYYEPDEVPTGFTVWLEPPGWKPIWLAVSERLAALRESGLSTERAPEDMAGVHQLANYPRQCFGISATYRIPASTRPRYTIGSMSVWFAPDKSEAARFFNRARRLLQTISSDLLIRSDPDTDPDLARPYQSGILVGFHARRFLRSDPAYTLENALRPSADDRPFKPRRRTALDREIAAEAKRPRSSEEMTHYRSLPLLLVEDDYAALLDALRAAIPNFRIVPYFYDWRVDIRPSIGGAADRGPWSSPGNGTLTYLDRLDDPIHRHVYVWSEPPGWQPQWADPREVYRLRNIEQRRRSGADASLRYRAGLIANLPPQRICFASARKLHHIDWFRHGEIAIAYRSADAEMQAFYRRVAAVVATVTRPIRAHLDAPGDRDRARQRLLTLWTGARAEQWLREDPWRCVENAHRSKFIVDRNSGGAPADVDVTGDALPGRVGSDEFEPDSRMAFDYGNLAKQIQALDNAQRHDLEG